MRRSLNRLINEFPPPVQPVESFGDWQEVETKLGLTLPDDYKDFIGIYGSVYINGFMYVFNPFMENGAANLLRNFPVRLKAQWEREKENPDPDIETRSRLFPYRFYPSKGGLFSWGITDGGDEFYWRTEGSPNHWDVVVNDRGSIRWFLIEGRSFADVLLAMLTDKLKEFWLQNDVTEGEPRCVALS